MKCEKCKSKELKARVLYTEYIYNGYFEEDIPVDTVEIECENCKHKWVV